MVKKPLIRKVDNRFLTLVYFVSTLTGILSKCKIKVGSMEMLKQKYRSGEMKILISSFLFLFSLVPSVLAEPEPPTLPKKSWLL